MTTGRRGGWRTINKRRYMRIRIGAKQRETVGLSGVRTDAEADERCAVIADVAETLVQAGRADRVRDFAVQLGEESSPKEIERIRQAAMNVAKTKAAAPGGVTFADFAKSWTSGELAQKYPDRVTLCDQSGNVSRLNKYILPKIGPVPMLRFGLDEAERVMAELPDGLSAATRRHVAQIIHRIDRLAVYPGRFYPTTKLPPGFLPKIPRVIAAPYLYPKEEAKLLACERIPLERRIAYAILAREGLRTSELLGADYQNGRETVDPAPWGILDLEHGVFRLDVNKTDLPRTWAMDPSVTRGLTTWYVLCGKPKPTAPIFPSAPWKKLAETLRADLKIAGVDRAELGVRSESRAWMKAHHLRATFVTLALANGKTETWVQDRTGHTSSLMINRYRRAARTAAELKLGWLAPLDVAIPELRKAGGANGGARSAMKGRKR